MCFKWLEAIPTWDYLIWHLVEIVGENVFFDVRAGKVMEAQAGQLTACCILWLIGWRCTEIDVSVEGIQMPHLEIKVSWIPQEMQIACVLTKHQIQWMYSVPLFAEDWVPNLSSPGNSILRQCFMYVSVISLPVVWVDLTLQVLISSELKPWCEACDRKKSLLEAVAGFGLCGCNFCPLCTQIIIKCVVGTHDCSD